jgi:hypothetical protein
VTGAAPAVSAVILPSPLLGPAVYEPLAAELTAAGWSAGVAGLPGDPSDPAEVLTAFRSAIPDADVLIAHSNAGYYLPALVQGRDVAVIAMDAALPVDGETTTALAPPQFARFATGLPLDEGRLPPWPAWWPRADVEPLFPSPDWFERVLRTAPRLRPSYLRGRLPVPAGWTTGRRAYLAFGETYAAELEWATAAGWRVRRIPGGHLEHLVDPETVAAELLRVMRGLSG